jgi:hypothetical protein
MRSWREHGSVPSVAAYGMFASRFVVSRRVASRLATGLVASRLAVSGLVASRLAVSRLGRKSSAPLRGDCWHYACARCDRGRFQRSRQGFVMTSWPEVENPDLVLLKVAVCWKRVAAARHDVPSIEDTERQSFVVWGPTCPQGRVVTRCPLITHKT